MGIRRSWPSAAPSSSAGTSSSNASAPAWLWRDYDPTTVPPDYQGYYARDQRLASGPHPGEPTAREVREEGSKFCVGTPADCIRFLEM